MEIEEARRVLKATDTLISKTGPKVLYTDWFDGNWESTWNFDRGADLYQYIRSLQPKIIVNNRVGKDRNASSDRLVVG